MKLGIVEVFTATGASWVTCRSETEVTEHLRKSLAAAVTEGAKVTVQVDDKTPLTEESVKLAWVPVREAKRAAAEQEPKDESLAEGIRK